MWHYRNPVAIDFGAGAFGRVADAVAGRSYVLVSHPDEVFDDPIERVVAAAGRPEAVVRAVRPNPDYESLSACGAELGRAVREPEVIVALGGGSVIDSAKVLAAAGDDFSLVRDYLETGEGAQQLRRTPVVAIPTTAGTGSEVTPWATVWDTDRQRKHSLTAPWLFPERALVDRSLTLGTPRALTLSTGLDALSHALESLWNVNANPVSSSFAVTAAREILDVLPHLVEALDDSSLRERMARASLFAGLAFSNTKTALAHSLSYPITLRYGTPHGIACSFCLPTVMRWALGHDPACDAALAAIFEADLEAGAERLASFLRRLGVSPELGDHAPDEDGWSSLLDVALAGERGRNYIGQPLPMEA